MSSHVGSEPKKKLPGAEKRTRGKTGKTTRASNSADKLSALDAAAKVLAERKQPMNAKELVEVMQTKGYWKSRGGKTPHATLYSAILREINGKEKDSRFKKVGRGKFARNR